VVDLADGHVHLVGREIVGSDVHVPGLVVLSNLLRGLEGDVSVEVRQRGGKSSVGPVVGRLQQWVGGGGRIRGTGKGKVK
jgi:hypothetical protein